MGEIRSGCLADDSKKLTDWCQFDCVNKYFLKFSSFTYFSFHSFPKAFLIISINKVLWWLIWWWYTSTLLWIRILLLTSFLFVFRSFPCFVLVAFVWCFVITLYCVCRSCPLSTDNWFILPAGQTVFWHHPGGFSQTNLYFSLAFWYSTLRHLQNSFQNCFKPIIFIKLHNFSIIFA